MTRTWVDKNVGAHGMSLAGSSGAWRLRVGLWVTSDFHRPGRGNRENAEVED